MRGTIYTAVFKAEAIKQITECGHGVVEASKRLGVSDKAYVLGLSKANKAIYQTPKILLLSN
jgi:transposase